MFFDTDPKTINNTLAQSAKFRYFCRLIFQTSSQLPEKTRGAIQNAIPIIFKEGHNDAKVSAEEIGEHDPLNPKHEVTDEKAQTRIHPAFYTPQESYEQWTTSIKHQHVRDAYIYYHNRTEHIKTLKVSHSEESLQMLPKMEKYFAIKLMTKKEDVATGAASTHGQHAEPPKFLLGNRMQRIRTLEDF